MKDLPRLELSGEQNSDGKNQYIIFRNEYKPGKKSSKKNTKKSTSKIHRKKHATKKKRHRKSRKGLFNIF